MTMNDIRNKTGKTREEIINSLINKKDITVPNNVVTTIKIVCLVISAVSILLSIYFSEKWIIQRLPNIYLAWSLSSIIVLFLNLSFPARVILKKLELNKEANIIAVLSIIIMAYSMISTVIGQFDQIPHSIEKSAIKKLNDARYENIDEQLKSNEKKYDTLINDKNKIIDTVYALKTELIKYEVGTDKYNSILYQINREESKLKTANNEIDTIYSEIKRLNKNKENFLNTIVTKDDYEEDKLTFFSWIQSMFIFIDKDILQLIVFLFPSIFIDVAAPFCLTLFVILSIKNKK